MIIAIQATDTAALQEIRELVWEELTTPELPDAAIARKTRLGAATNEIFAELKWTQSDFDALTDGSPRKEAVIVAIMNRTAAKILPSVPQLTRESALGDSAQYAMVDWRQKVEFLESEVNRQIQILTPDDPVQGEAIGFFGKV